jgi:hypothetical protein
MDGTHYNVKLSHVNHFRLNAIVWERFLSAWVIVDSPLSFVILLVKIIGEHMSLTIEQKQAWSWAAKDTSLIQQSPSLNVFTVAIVAFVLAFGVSVLTLDFFGAASDYMAISALSIPVIIGVLLFALDGMVGTVVKIDAKFAPIMKSKMIQATVLVCLFTFLGHFMGFVIEPLLPNLA